LGLSETRLSNILGEKRKDLVIATKGGVSWKYIEKGRAKTSINCSPDYIRAAVENSLKRLRLDNIPVYYIHWPKEGVDVALIADALYKLQCEGKINTIGCSNFSANQLERALEFAPIKLLQKPVNILLEQPSDEIVKVCRKNGVGIVGYNVLASGLLTGKFDINTTFPDTDRRSRLPQFVGDGLRKSLSKLNLLRENAYSVGQSLTHYSIKGALEEPEVNATIIGIKNVNQLKENLMPFYE
jgi:aryl-alcohol dehydrogenase-like predicted oxidoreductase